MIKLAIENGKFIIKNGKIAVVEDSQSACGCCCNCCWKIDTLEGCPGPEMEADLSNYEFKFIFKDSKVCSNGGDPCDINNQKKKNNDTSTDKTPCSRAQTIKLTNEWTIEEETNITIDLSGIAEIVSPGFDFIEIKLTPKDGQGETHSLKVGSEDGSVGSDDDPCAMVDVSKSDNFTLEPGCWSVTIISSTGDALWHYGMWNKIKISFSDKKPKNCKDYFCTSAICAGLIGGGTGGTGADGEAPVNPADLTGSCDLEDYDNPEGKPSKIEDCIKDCDKSPDNPCKNTYYYCCVDGVCERLKKKVCKNDETTTECSESGPYFCTLKQCTESSECATKYCCENNTCKPCNKTKSSDEKDGVGASTYDSIEECRDACETGATYNCTENMECVKADAEADVPSQYKNIQECLENCEENPNIRYTCTPAGECVRNINGEYLGIQACNDDCGDDGGGGGKNWYCCYNLSDGEIKQKLQQGQVIKQTAQCQLGGCFDEDGNPTPARVASGPHSQKLCALLCTGYNCVEDCRGNKTCQKSNTGIYPTRGKCNNKCGKINTKKPPCSLTEGGALPPIDDNNFLGLMVENKAYEADYFERRICVSYATNGHPIKFMLMYPRYDANCNFTGWQTNGTDWYGEKRCDCEARKQRGGTIKNELKGKINLKKPRGIKSFWIVVLSCIGSDYKFEVDCEPGCKPIPDIDEAKGACCRDNVCSDDVSKKDCAKIINGLKGKFFGPCSKCADINNDCNEDVGACCLPNGECIDNRTRNQCTRPLDQGGDNGIYMGDGTFCENEDNRNNPNVPKDKLVLCENAGACCETAWIDIPINMCEVVDKIMVGNKEASTIETTDCENMDDVCESIDIDVTKKSIKCIDLKYKNVLAGKIGSVNAITDITLPSTDCDNNNQGGDVIKTEIIALEDYPNSYEELFEIKTEKPTLNPDYFAIVYNDKVKIGEVAIETSNITGKVSGVYIADKDCLITTKEDCDNKNGAFTPNQLCCKTFAQNGVDCEEEWCGDDLQIQSSVSNGIKYTISSSNEIVKNKVIGGPGTELKKLLSKIGIDATPTCSCNSRARVMDEWGPDICEREIGTIIDWLREEANKRNLPFVDIAGYILIKRAIHNARKKLK